MILNDAVSIEPCKGYGTVNSENAGNLGKHAVTRSGSNAGLTESNYDAIRSRAGSGR